MVHKYFNVKVFLDNDDYHHLTWRRGRCLLRRCIRFRGRVLSERRWQCWLHDENEGFYNHVATPM